MEGLNPSLKCLIEVQGAIQNGETVRVGLTNYLAGTTLHDPFASSIRRFLFAWDQGQNWRNVIAEISSPHRRALLEVSATGLSGKPVLTHLNELRDELTAASTSEIAKHLELLPVKMLIPLLFFQFPAFLLLLFGPLLAHFLREMSR